jgi:hypothetical protein
MFDLARDLEYHSGIPALPSAGRARCASGFLRIRPSEGCMRENPEAKTPELVVFSRVPPQAS